MANPSCSIGGDFTCGTSTGGQYVQLTDTDGSQNAWVASVNGSTVPYINPTDNPKRPRPSLLVWADDYGSVHVGYGSIPGTVHDISMYPAKLGIAGGLLDIQNNHPNDLVSMILFSRPQYSNDPAGDGAFNLAQYSLSRDYASMINSLWYPPNASLRRASLGC